MIPYLLIIMVALVHMEIYYNYICYVKLKLVEFIMQYFFLTQGHRSAYHDYKKLLSNSISSENCFTNIKSTHFLTQEKYVIVRTSCTMKISSFISFFIRKTLPCIKRSWFLLHQQFFITNHNHIMPFCAIANLTIFSTVGKKLLRY